MVLHLRTPKIYLYQVILKSSHTFSRSRSRRSTSPSFRLTVVINPSSAKPASISLLLPYHLYSASLPHTPKSSRLQTTKPCRQCSSTTACSQTTSTCAISLRHWRAHCPMAIMHISNSNGYRPHFTISMQTSMLKVLGRRLHSMDATGIKIRVLSFQIAVGPGVNHNINNLGQDGTARSC
ncbi:hypothetical protein BGY98DRAFT_485974 [Russula aff. rugulosa BPL654]|nr:hypothetical protein BGY98DRAFT_485974 [Russula aff. rugulosa BPL654]